MEQILLAVDTRGRNLLYDSQIYNEVALLRVAVDELKDLVAGLKTDISTRKTELTNLKNQVKQEQSALAVLQKERNVAALAQSAPPAR